MAQLRSIFFLVFLAALAACAQMEPPPGGPVDETSPVLLGSSPENESRLQGDISSYELLFSEPVDPLSVEEALESDPSRLIRSLHWEGDTLLQVELWDSFPEDSTVAIYLKPGWKDRNARVQGEWQVFHFSTGPELLPGWLGGQVSFKGASSRNMKVILRDKRGELHRYQEAPRGDFLFRHLPVDGREMLLFAFEDVDGDSLYQPEVDFADSLQDSLFLLPEEPRKFGFQLDVIDPGEPGTIIGRFACLDTLPGLYFLRLYPDSLRMAGDSLPEKDVSLWSESLLHTLRSTPDSLTLTSREMGDFEFRQVKPGNWALFLFKDLGGDSLWDAGGEPAWLEPGPLYLEPGGNLTLPTLTFPFTNETMETGMDSTQEAGDEK